MKQSNNLHNTINENDFVAQPGFQNQHNHLRASRPAEVGPQTVSEMFIGHNGPGWGLDHPRSKEIHLNSPMDS